MESLPPTSPPFGCMLGGGVLSNQYFSGYDSSNFIFFIIASPSFCTKKLPTTAQLQKQAEELFTSYLKTLQSRADATGGLSSQLSCSGP